MRAPEIRSVLIGKFVTDESHWADQFLVDGKMGGHQLGQAQTGTWTLSRSGEVCTVTKTKTKSPESSCFEIWLNGDQVQYRNGDILYDVPNVELSHVGEFCSFDAFLKKYALTEPALLQLAEIVRGADTSNLDLTPQSAGLYAISLGLSKEFSDDYEMLKHGMVMYDALYAWCKSCQDETQNWPPLIK